MNIKKMFINDLIPASYNPRKDLKPSDKEYQKIKTSIETFGYVEPIIVNYDFTIVGGHQRLKVLKDLGFKEVDVVQIDVDKSQEKALNIALNKISGEWDFEMLESLLQELRDEDFDISLTGFDLDEIQSILEGDEISEPKEDDFDVESELENVIEPITKRGNVWILGNHRLMCGDSTNKNDVQKLMNNQKVDLIVTDPPYNVDYTGKTKDALKIENDKKDNDSFYQFLFDAHSRMYEHANDGAGIYVFHSDSEGLNFNKALIESGFKLSQCCIWVKQTLVMGRKDYHSKHEPILYGWKPTGSHNWYTDRKQTTVWEFDRPSRNAEHPTMKPIPLISYPIQNSSKINDKVMDLFGGSGSTLIACEQLKRSCFTMELDPKYCDVIVKRWETLTEKKAVLENATS